MAVDKMFSERINLQSYLIVRDTFRHNQILFHFAMINDNPNNGISIINIIPSINNEIRRNKRRVLSGK